MISCKIQSKKVFHRKTNKNKYLNGYNFFLHNTYKLDNFNMRCFSMPNWVFEVTYININLSPIILAP